MVTKKCFITHTVEATITMESEDAIHTLLLESTPEELRSYAEENNCPWEEHYDEEYY